MRHLQPIRGIDTAGNRKVRDPHDRRIDRAAIFGEGQAAADRFFEMALRPSAGRAVQHSTAAGRAGGSITGPVRYTGAVRDHRSAVPVEKGTIR